MARCYYCKVKTLLPSFFQKVLSYPAHSVSMNGSNQLPRNSDIHGVLLVTLYFEVQLPINKPLTTTFALINSSFAVYL